MTPRMPFRRYIPRKCSRRRKASHFDYRAHGAIHCLTQSGQLRFRQDRVVEKSSIAASTRSETLSEPPYRFTDIRGIFSRLAAAFMLAQGHATIMHGRSPRDCQGHAGFHSRFDAYRRTSRRRKQRPSAFRVPTRYHALQRLIYTAPSLRKRPR